MPGRPRGDVPQRPAPDVDRRADHADLPAPGGHLTFRAVLLALFGLLAAAPALAQEPLSVETSLPADGWVDADDRVELRLSRPLDLPLERIAVFFDHVDVTDLFQPTADGLAYDRSAPPLPRGEGEVVVSLIAADGTWTEVARAPLRVRGRLGFEQATFDPGFDAGIAGRVDAGRDPEEEGLEEFDQNLTGQITLASTHARGDFSIVSETAFVGTTIRQEALRFGEEGRDAPKLDLSSYRVEVRRGPVALAVGHVGFGRQRHLVNGFDSRGALLSWNPTGRFDLALSVVNGSSVVGLTNVVGLDDPDHRVVSATLGVEGLARPGALRLELTWLGARIQPAQPDFNQGVIDDAEESRGLGVALRTETPGRRLGLEAGFARSRYDNPFDPTLAQGDDLVPVEAETRNARYVEATVGLFRNRSLFGSRTATLDLALRHARVDPEYQTVGAFVRSDEMVNDAQLRGSIAGVQLQVTHARSEDNLDDVESVLTTKTEKTGGTIGLPVATVFGVESTRAVWFPQLRYQVDRTHQKGDGVPPNSGFTPQTVPDQVSLSQTGSLDWRWSRITAGYRINVSEQDNRQPSRERSDLDNRVHAFTLGVRPHDRLTVDLQLGLERRRNRERDEVDETRRWGARSTLSLFSATQLTAAWAATHVEDEAKTRERDDATLDVQLASGIPWLDAFGGQWFLRLSKNTAESRDARFDVADDRSEWNLDSGLNFTFF